MSSFADILRADSIFRQTREIQAEARAKAAESEATRLRTENARLRELRMQEARTEARAELKAEFERTGRIPDTPSEPSDTNALALAIVNAGRRANGLPVVTKLVQDDTVASFAEVPTDPEGFARAVAAAHRKALNLPPLKPGEFISIRQLRGEL